MTTTAADLVRILPSNAAIKPSFLDHLRPKEMIYAVFSGLQFTTQNLMLLVLPESCCGLYSFAEYTGTIRLWQR